MLQFLFCLLPSLSPVQHRYITALDFHVEESEVIVEYGLLPTVDGGYYSVAVQFKTSAGVFTPQDVYGDVGEKIYGGQGKRIVWPVLRTLNELKGDLTVELVVNLYSEKKTTPTPQGMLSIQGGAFEMGDLNGDGGSEEQPKHKVTLSDYMMDSKEITFEQYDAYTNAKGLPLKPDNGWGRGGRPVIYVSWYEAIEYCNWRSGQEGLTPYYNLDKSKKDPTNWNKSDKLAYKVGFNPQANGYRLPTEAEWEYAAREQGKKVRFGNGQSKADPVQLNFDPSYPNAYSKTGKNRQKTSSVGSLTPNGLGIYDMSGNVWEWCFDWYDANYYRTCQEEPELATNPQGAESGMYRCIKGGAWNSTPSNCRVSCRNSMKPDLSSAEVGFRCVRNTN